MTYGKIFYGKKNERKKKTRKMFSFFQIRKTFYRKMILFSVDHLFSTKQTSENIKNIFLKIIFNETNGAYYNILLQQAITKFDTFIGFLNILHIIYPFEKKE